MKNNFKLKLDSQNQITVQKQKDSWSREEVIAFTTNLRWFVNEKQRTVYEVDKWIKENL